MNNCDNCLYLREANKLKIPEIIVPADKDLLPRKCRKCYQDERKKIESERVKILEEKIQIVIRNINAGAVSVNWIKEFLDQKINETKDIKSAKNDIEAVELFWSGYEPLCPECSRRAFATNFKPEHLGGKKNDKRIVWFCSDMGHCTFSIGEDTKWQKRKT